MEIPVEKKDIAIIIGTKGATMNKLQDETGTKIQVFIFIDLTKKS